MTWCREPDKRPASFASSETVGASSSAERSDLKWKNKLGRRSDVIIVGNNKLRPMWTWNMKIFHLREKSSQHLLLPVWVVLGLVGRKLELAVPFSQLLQMKVHLDMFGIKKSCFFFRWQTFLWWEKKRKAHLSHARLYFASRLLQIQRWTITESQNITIYHLEQCNKYI